MCGASGDKEGGLGGAVDCGMEYTGGGTGEGVVWACRLR